MSTERVIGLYSSHNVGFSLRNLGFYLVYVLADPTFEGVENPTKALFFGLLGCGRLVHLLINYKAVNLTIRFKWGTALSVQSPEKQR